MRGVDTPIYAIDINNWSLNIKPITRQEISKLSVYSVAYLGLSFSMPFFTKEKFMESWGSGNLGSSKKIHIYIQIVFKTHVMLG